jgi:hypothetical protein
MRTVVIYPGRFHPFHRGHKASYDYLVKRYGAENVFVVSSDKQDADKSPFSFADKMAMMTKLGIPAGRIAQVLNPYQAKEITSEIDDKDNTVLIFAVSEKDMSGPEARFDFRPKKDGSAGYIQPIPDSGKLQPMTNHAYVAVTPTVNFQVRGADANSASEIRKEYIKGNDADREQIIADLYGDMDAGIKDIFDRKLRAPTAVNESRERIAKKINLLRERIAQLKEFAPSFNPGDDNDEDPVPNDLHRFANLWWNAADPEIQRYIEDQLATGGWTIQQVDYDHVLLKHRDGKQYIISDDTFDPDLHESSDYIEEKWSQRYKRSINCSNPRGFSQRAHCAGRKK